MTVRERLGRSTGGAWSRRLVLVQVQKLEEALPHAIALHTLVLHGPTQPRREVVHRIGILHEAVPLVLGLVDGHGRTLGLHRGAREDSLQLLHGFVL